MTGGRLLRIKEYTNNETFMMTYGDGVANVNVNELIKFHKSKNQIATVTAAQPFGRFGSLDIDKDNNVKAFVEKPSGDGKWVNAGFFVLEPKVFDYIEGDSTFFEREPLEGLAKTNQLAAFHHHGFWMPMDKLSDKNELENLWVSGKAPWKVW
jgi:glucose-1-phosphate cytidylyltransferase